MYRSSVCIFGGIFMSKDKEEKSNFDRDDTYDRMYFGKGGCMLFLAVVAIIYIIFDIYWR